MKLVIAEKPSVALTLAKAIGANTKKDGYCEGSGYIVSWCVGHLIQMSNPDKINSQWKIWSLGNLPMIPKEYKYEITKATKKQYAILKKLLDSDRVNTVVNACDAGREGELIFRLVYNQAKCKKKIQRLWISSMENKAIEDGFKNLKDGSNYENLYKSASARAIADWLVGMNLSRLYSCLYNQSYSVGRVQTPTLYLIAKRDSEISTFKKQKYYTVDIASDNIKLVSERIDDLSEANSLLKNIKSEYFNKDIELTNVENKEVNIKPEKPYDLTTLQREANKYFGYSANDTLNTTQSLYEKKLVTYPRTDSRYLTNDMTDTIKELLQGLDSGYAINEDNFNSIFDSSKVTDHYAIIPTLTGISKADGLTGKEYNVYMLIKNKLLASCSDNLIESNTNVSIIYQGHNFSTKGKSVIEQGFTKYLQEYIKNKGDSKLPNLSQGDLIKLNSFELSEKYTKPQSHYNENTLLKAMETAGVDALDKNIEVERKGLGTPATRASIIESLIRKELVERDKKNLLITDKGNRLVAVVEDKFKSADITSEWEMKLSKISSGEVDAEDFIKEIEKSITEVIDRYKKNIK